MSLPGSLSALAPRTLGARLLIVILVAFGVLALVMERYVSQRLEQAYSRSGQATVTAIAAAFSDDFDEGLLERPAVLRQRLDRLREIDPSISELSVYTAAAGGSRLVTTDLGELAEPVGVNDLEPIRTGRPVYEEERESERHLGELSFPLHEPGRAPVASLGIYYDLAPLDAALARDRRFVALLTAGLALAVVLALLLVLRMTVLRPLARLTSAARRIGDGESGVRLGWQRQDELGQVAAEFDEMAGDLERTHGRLEALASTDPLTGLLNHRTFRERLEDELARAARDAGTLTVLALDVDDFKGLNDTHGHAAGDEALREVAACIVAELRPGDFCGRVGGDEFAVVLTGTSATNAEAVAQRLRASVARLRPGADATTTLSIGIAAFIAGAGMTREAEWVRRLHERWDGRGYPGGLEGHDIPLASRVLHAADMLESMTSSRVYRPGQPVEFALFEIEANAGSQLDPAVAGALAALLRSGRTGVPANATAAREPAKA